MKQITQTVKYTVALDWFEQILTGELVKFGVALDKYEYDQGNIRIVKKPAGTKLYQNRFSVYIKNKPFGEICTDPRNTAILNPAYIQFKANNNVLYEVGFLEDVKYFYKKMDWKVNNTTRIDIALDGIGFFNMIEQWSTGSVEKIGKARVNCYYTSKRVMTGFDVGSKASSKWLTCYNKTEELALSNKHYIGDMWKRSGLNDTDQDIERLEIKLRNEALKKMPDFDWQRLDDFEFLASLHRTALHNFFEFIPSTAGKNISRKEKINFIDWDNVGGVMLDRLSTKKTNEVYRMKQGSKTMYMIYLATDKIYYAKIAQEMASNVNCIQWFIDKYPEWTKEFKREMGENKDGLINYEYLSEWKTYKNLEQLKLYAPDLTGVHNGN